MKRTVLPNANRPGIQAGQSLPTPTSSPKQDATGMLAPSQTQTRIKSIRLRRGLQKARAEAVAQLIDPTTLHWIAFSHFEADECGSLREWQTLASERL